MADILNLKRKFQVAVEGFAVSDEPLPQRLRHVFVGNLEALRDADFPPDIVIKWKQIDTRMTAAGGYAETIQNMSRTQAEQLITEIVAISYDLAVRVGRAK